MVCSEPSTWRARRPPSWLCCKFASARIDSFADMTG